MAHDSKNDCIDYLGLDGSWGNKNLVSYMFYVSSLMELMAHFIVAIIPVALLYFNMYKCVVSCSPQCPWLKLSGRLYKWFEVHP